MRRLLALSSALAAALAYAPPALAQGGVTAPDFDDPCPAVYPGDGAAKAQIARWMAGAAATRGLPWALPVMAGLAESGLTNLRGQRYAGFFGMSQALNDGDYRGFPKKPDLQLRWFLDSATLVRQQRVAEGRPDPAADSEAFGIWIADVERPAPENRSGYQKYLEEAVKLAGTRCPAPVRADTVPPPVRVRVAAKQRPLRTMGIVVRVRCPDEDCLAGAFGTLSVGGRSYSLRARAVDPEGGWATLTLRLPRPVRKQLARRRSLRARVTGVAADAAANAASAERPVRLLP